MLHFSAVSSEALELLREIQSLPVLNDFYLVGGTALALHYGHRMSVDLDFFTDNEFDTHILIDSFKEKYKLQILSQAKNTLTLNIRSVKADFIRHNYPLLNPVQTMEGIKLLSVEDIAAMKLNSMMNRGSKKDFYDIDELLNHFNLMELISFYNSKYDFSSQLILLKSLVYFVDAEQEPDPVSIKSKNWDSVKQKINDSVSSFSKR
ncbi:MAG TPA: nucleotidyl transferase AbiEii/AbiGii toxin family protein [Bacteroidia bacterium]|nr:nucleotidyl transferase AbiEii/AbiGii toxin family protein [Bacteroidia bacterium]